MISSSLVSLLLLSVASAAPYINERGANSTKWAPLARAATLLNQRGVDHTKRTPSISEAPYLHERSLNSTKWTPDHVLQPHEVLLYGEGGKRMEVVHRDVWEEVLKSRGIAPRSPSMDESFHDLSVRHTGYSNDTKLNTRGECDDTGSVVTDKTFDFVDWDVQMSPVVTAGMEKIEIFVMKGYTVTNSINVATSVDYTFIEKVLSASVSVDYGRSWATQTTINIKGTVSPGYTGCMITKPYKTRRVGRVFKGCPGSLKQISTFQADNYKEGSYDGIPWVSGTISVCQKKGDGPLSRCSGSGNFV